MKKLKPLLFFYISLSTVFFSLNIFVIIFSIFFEKKDTNDFIEEIDKIINYKAYINNDLKIKTDSSYVNLIVEDFKKLLLNNESIFEYHPTTEVQHKTLNSAHTNILDNKNDYNTRKTFREENFILAQEHKSIYCFGGSTTFGSFVYDRHTWPSQLAELLYKDSVLVKNYGQASFTPTQETNQFIELLKTGHRPSIAIFMDGINIGPQHDGSDFSRLIDQLIISNETSFLKKTLSMFPLFQIFSKNSGFGFLEADNEILDIHTDESNNYLVINRFLYNSIIRKKIGEHFGVKVYQFLQPNAFVDYNLDFLNTFNKKRLGGESLLVARKNYNLIYKGVVQQDSTFIDFSNLFAKFNKPAVVDLIHYSPSFNAFLAQEIKSYINLDSTQYHNIYANKASGLIFR